MTAVLLYQHPDGLGEIEFDGRQLRRLAMAEECYARALDSLMDTDAHHKAINEQAKHAVQAFAAATGGREVPGVDRAARRLAAVRQSGLAGLDVLVPLASASLTAGVGAVVLRLLGVI